MRCINLKQLFIVLLTLLPVVVWAGETPLFLYRGLRATSMGNAYEAIADDLSAVHYNPAGLTQIEKVSFQTNRTIKPIANAQIVFDHAHEKVLS